MQFDAMEILPIKFCGYRDVITGEQLDVLMVCWVLAILSST